MGVAIYFWSCVISVAIGAIVGALVPELTYIIGAGYGFVVWLALAIGFPLVGLFGVLD